MWNKRQDEPTPRPASAAPNPVSEVKKEPTSVSTMPFKTPESESPRGSATIGKAVKINGQIFSKEDLYVDGDVEGNVELQEHKLTVGPNGKLQAGIRAREVVVLGQVHGNVEALDKIEIRKDARLVGDIKTARIIIEDGAYFKGSIDIVKSEQAKVPATAAAAAANPPRPQTQTVTPNSASPAAVGAEVKR
jgi:cytoskeletal protein CcmA (bactofilin family)